MVPHRQFCQYAFISQGRGNGISGAHGVSSFVIQTLGRWRSNTFLTYIDITDGTVGNAFARVVGLDDVTDETSKR